MRVFFLFREVFKKVGELQITRSERAGIVKSPETI